VSGSPPRRVLVVGGSSGIGRSLAVLLGREGAAVAVAARRSDLVDEVAADAGPKAIALACDVTDEAQCRRLVVDAADALGGLDVVIYAAAISPLGDLGSTSGSTWLDVFATNVIGAGMVIAAAMGHLQHGAHPAAVLLSSHSVGQPWPGLVPYAASKAALDELALGLRAEEPWLRVVRVVVGPTATPFADGWDPDVAGPLFERWAAEGYLGHDVQEPTDVAARVLAILRDPGTPDDVVVIGEHGPG
jgi:NAD(P)-dependent dehydrogenase (short-subunit alcohol dehydrogenase family)